MSPSGSRRPGRRRSRIRSLVIALQVMILLGISGAVGVVLGMFINLSGVLPTVGSIEAPEATLIYSSDGVILGRIFREDRTNVPLKEIPQDLRDATIAIEDSRFYQHSGVDMRGIARALWQNLRGQRMAQGGSTITQQLARNVYLTQRKTVQRKVQEAVLAIMMERHFTKDKILELYLNQIYYGSGSFGAQAASRVYFGKDVGQLDLSESALLAGLPQKPSAYSPHEHIELALDRRDVVLNRMCTLGYITAAERDRAKRERIRIATRRRGRGANKAPHFVDYVTNELRYRYGDDMLYRGGLRVYTTLDSRMQEAAETALRQGVKKFEKSRRVSEGCFVCIEPQNGYVRAMVGSVSPESYYNRATQMLRQPGSSFKAFVYTAALEAGMRPTDRVSDSPVSYPSGGGKRWTPRNYDGIYRGRVTLKTAVAKSINMVAIRVADKVGIENVIKYARLMGITADIEPYLTTAIGGIKGVRPIEMASAYGTFANDGVYVEPCSIVRVTDSHGEIIEDYVPEGRRVISEKVCKMMDEMLRAVVTSGTGYAAARIHDARGKTGTTNDDRDAWWIGYVPGKLVAACWVGNDDYSPMRRAYGGLVCAPVWAEFMQKALPVYEEIHKDESTAAKSGEGGKKDASDRRDSARTRRSSEETSRERPDVTVDDDSDTITLRLCDDSNLLATPNCPDTHTDRFIQGTEPTSYCAIHENREPPAGREPSRRAVTPPDVTLVTVTICPESGLLATPNCPQPTRKRIPIDEVPTALCGVHGRRESR